MAKINPDPLSEITYPVGAVSRLTGLSPDVLRAWERRYRIVQPTRTDGGTRRYSAQEVERLLLVKTAVDAGHRIGQVARMDEAQLRQLAVRHPPELAPPNAGIAEVLASLERLDSAEAERLLSQQLAALGPTRFAQEVALPLLQEIGREWEESRLCIASEHLGSTLLRSLLGACLRPTRVHREAPRIVFATPPGERHEMGLLIAAISALSAGAQPIFLGIELPEDQLVHAVRSTGARALALGIVRLPRSLWEPFASSLRSALPADVELWVGGRVDDLEPPAPGVHVLGSVADLERRVELLSLQPRASHSRPATEG